MKILVPCPPSWSPSLSKCRTTSHFTPINAHESAEMSKSSDVALFLYSRVRKSHRKSKCIIAQLNVQCQDKNKNPRWKDNSKDYHKHSDNVWAQRLSNEKWVNLLDDWILSMSFPESWPELPGSWGRYWMLQFWLHFYYSLCFWPLTQNFLTSLQLVPHSIGIKNS